MKILMTIMCGDSESMEIRDMAEDHGMIGDNMDLIDETGEGDSRVRLWRMPWGQRVIETGNDRIWENNRRVFAEECGRFGLEPGSG